MRMRKFVPLFVISAMLFKFSIAHAGLSWSDPALCVKGEWLVVDAAHDKGVTVVIPEGTPYGDQIQGGCPTAPPVPLFERIDRIVRQRDVTRMKVKIDGQYASSPTLTVSYMGSVVVFDNPGYGIFSTRFDLPADPVEDDGTHDDGTGEGTGDGTGTDGTSEGTGDGTGTDGTNEGTGDGTGSDGSDSDGSGDGSGSEWTDNGGTGDGSEGDGSNWEEDDD